MNPRFFKEKVAIYLNEHPEFFNDYPELLGKIKSIDIKDLPLQPLHTLSVADRIIQRVRDDREHIKNKLEWFIELARGNEKIHEHLYEIEQMVLSSNDLLIMFAQLRAEIVRRFEIQHVVVCLLDRSEHFMEDDLPRRYPAPIDGSWRFVEQNALSSWFDKTLVPVLRGEINGKSKIFTLPKNRGTLRSEALVPLIIRDNLVGCLGLGSVKPLHFHEDMESAFLTRMAGKLAIAIDNILLLDRLKRQTVKDPLTGHYNRSYFDPVLMREFDRCKHYQKKLSCIIMCIDYFEDLVDTYGRKMGEFLLKETGDILGENCRVSDVVIRYDETRFFALLPETPKRNAHQIAERVRKDIENRLSTIVSPKSEKITASLGLAAYPGKDTSTREKLVQTAFKNLTKAVKEGGNRVISAH